MKVHEKGHTILISDSHELQGFVMKLTHEYKTFENHNLIIDVSQIPDVTLKSLSQFLPLARMHKKARKSFVIVAAGVDYTAAPASLNIVPTTQEAFDLIEMDEIERDLGF